MKTEKSNLRSNAESMTSGLNTCLWFGPVLGEENYLANPAASPAANRWQLAFLNAMIGNGWGVKVIGFDPMRTWPIGKWRQRSQNIRVSGISVQHVGFLNMFRLREAVIARAYRLEYLHTTAGSSTCPRLVMTYNLTRANSSVGQFARSLGALWINVLADQDDLKPFWKTYKQRGGSASGHLFLSYQAFVECPYANKLFLEGGVSKLRWEDTVKPGHFAVSPRPRFVYSGLIAASSGIKMILKAIALLPDLDCEFVFCGKGMIPELRSAAVRDSRIRVLGMLSESDLEKVLKSATHFLNPRDPEIEENRYNFPSKILEYLAYGRPIISTRTPGLSPVYAKCLNILDSASAECLAAELKRQCSDNGEGYQLQTARVRELATQVSWENRIRLFVEWAQTIQNSRPTRKDDTVL